MQGKLMLAPSVLCLRKLVLPYFTRVNEMWLRAGVLSSTSFFQRCSCVKSTGAPIRICTKQELTPPLLILAKPSSLVLGPTTRPSTLDTTTGTCTPLLEANQLYVSLLIRPTSRLSTPLLLGTATSKCTLALVEENQLNAQLLSFGYPLALENNQMYGSIPNKLYKSLKTDLVRNLLSDYSFRMMRGTYGYWDLRLTCDYAHQDGKHELIGFTMHGLWLCRISGSRVVHLAKNTNGDEWRYNLKIAEKLLDQLDPEVKSKMDLHWYTIRHTSESKKLWIEQMCKHGYLSCEYWEKAVGAAMPFLSSNGILNIMKILKEEMFVSGNFTGQELQDALYNRTGRKIDLMYKRMNGKTYPGEVGLLHDSKLNFLSYPSDD